MIKQKPLAGEVERGLPLEEAVVELALGHHGQTPLLPQMSSPYSGQQPEKELVDSSD